MHILRKTGNYDRHREKIPGRSVANRRRVRSAGQGRACDPGKHERNPACRSGIAGNDSDPQTIGQQSGRKRVPFVRPDERIPERYRNEKQYQTVPGSLFRRLPGRRLRLQRFRIPRHVPNAGKQVRIHHPADRAGFDQTDQTGLRRL